MIYIALVKVGFCHFKCVFEVIDRSKWDVSYKNMIEWTSHNMERKIH